MHMNIKSKSIVSGGVVVVTGASAGVARAAAVRTEQVARDAERADAPGGALAAAAAALGRRR